MVRVFAEHVVPVLEADAQLQQLRLESDQWAQVSLSSDLAMSSARVSWPAASWPFGVLWSAKPSNAKRALPIRNGIFQTGSMLSRGRGSRSLPDGRCHSVLCGGGARGSGTRTRHGTTGYRPWAELLARSFAVDVLTCSSCHGRMRQLAVIKDPAQCYGTSPRGGGGDRSAPPLCNSWSAVLEEPGSPRAGAGWGGGFGQPSQRDGPDAVATARSGRGAHGSLRGTQPVPPGSPSQITRCTASGNSAHGTSARKPSRFRIDRHRAAEALAGGAGAEGVVEREQRRRGVGVADVAAGTMQTLAVAARLVFARDAQLDPPLRLPQRGLDRVYGALPRCARRAGGRAARGTGGRRDWTSRRSAGGLRVEHVEGQGRLAGASHAGHRRHGADRHADADALQVVLPPCRPR